MPKLVHKGIETEVSLLSEDFLQRGLIWPLKQQNLHTCLFFLPWQLSALAQRRHKLSSLHVEHLDSNEEYLTHGPMTCPFME